MSVLSPEKVALGNGSDLASLVIAYHRINHAAASPAQCVESMCVTAHEVIEMDAMLYGLDAEL